jgi:prolyl-tRNA synthetase
MKKENVVEASDKIYSELIGGGFSVLYDDRVDAQAGFKFNDADLLGMPVQVIVGDKKLKENRVEVKVRETGERFDIEPRELKDKITEILRPLTK